MGLASLYMHTELTPADQLPADPDLFPNGTLRHMEFEGSDGKALGKILLKL